MIFGCGIELNMEFVATIPRLFLKRQKKPQQQLKKLSCNKEEARHLETRELLRGNTDKVVVAAAAPVPHKTDMRVEFADMCRIYFLCFGDLLSRLSCSRPLYVLRYRARWVITWDTLISVFWFSFVVFQN